MRSFLVLTDFSVPAENAMFFAGQLAQLADASLTLLHVYQVPVSMNDVPVLMISAEELRDNVDKNLLRTKELLQSRYPSLQVSTESRLGDIIEETNEICTVLKPLAIVAGKHGANAVERFLFGSTSLSVIRHGRFPVLVVPDSVHPREVRNIAIALDPTIPDFPVETISEFAGLIKARLHMVHVKVENSAEEIVNRPLASQLNADFTVIHDREFVHGIQTFIGNKDIDMLLIMPHKHTLIEKLIFRTHTEELMRKISLPILCIPGH